VQAQQPAVSVVGFLHAAYAEQNVQRLAAYRKGLRDAGFVEGQNVAIEFRWANGHLDQLPNMAADLIRRQVAVIATPAKRRVPACRCTTSSKGRRISAAQSRSHTSPANHNPFASVPKKSQRNNGTRA
jgi:hypothetical protein